MDKNNITITKGTILRTVLLVLAIANQIVAVIGMTSFASVVWYQILSVVLTATTAFISAWKNNDFTYFARLSSAVLHALKDGKIEENEVKDLLEKACNKSNEENNNETNS